VEKKGWLMGRHDNADHIGAVAIEVAGEFVGNVIELLHGNGHALTHVVGHIAGVVHDQ
jgi:outer membrane lipoprotein SlyB